MQLKINQLGTELDMSTKEKQLLYKDISEMEQRMVSHQQSEFDALQRAKELVENVTILNVH